MNCLMETLSLISFLPENDDDYRINELSMIPEGIEVPRPFKGKQTNEAPTKYFIWLLSKQEQMFDKIVVLVTEECTTEKKECAGNKTTYEYYKKSVIDYVNELSGKDDFVKKYLSEKHNGSAQEYVDKTMVSVTVPEGVSAGQWSDLVQMINEYGKNSDKTDIYVDFTGGSRLASLISLLLLRIIEMYSINVKQMIYSDITDRRDRKLVDCTESYRILSNIENIAKAGSDKEIRTHKIISEFIKMGLASESDMVGVEELDKQLVQSERKLVTTDIGKQSVDKIQPKNESRSSIAETVKKQQINTVHDNLRRSPFSKLSARRDDDLIVTFREEILFVMIDKKFISTIYGNDSIDSIMREMQANERYYCDNDRRGVIPFTRGIIQRLSKQWENNQKYDPLEDYQLHIKGTRFLNDYIKSIKYKSNMIGMPYKYDSIFQKYLEENGYSGIDKWKLLDLQRVYFNHSFPFMCVYLDKKGGGSYIYPVIMNYYKEKVEELMTNLSDLKKRNEDDYVIELENLSNKDKGQLELKVPYMSKTDSWNINTNKFANTSDSDTFLRELLERIEIVRPYRNAIVHHLNNKYNEIDEKRKIAKEIKEWLKEYEEMLSKLA